MFVVAVGVVEGHGRPVTRQVGALVHGRQRQGVGAVRTLRRRRRRRAQQRLGRRLPQRLEVLLADAELGGAVDLDVDDEHEEQGQVEGAHRGEDGVAPVLRDEALACLVGVVVGVLPAEERRDGDRHTDRPAQRDHDEDTLGRSVADIVHLSDGPVAVQRDGHQVQNAGRAAEHVEGDPHVTDLGAEEPLRADLVDGGERHDERRDHQVGHGQRDDEVVGHVLQVLLQDDGGDDEHVADDGGQDERAQGDGRGQQVRHAVGFEGEDEAPPAARPRPVDGAARVVDGLQQTEVVVSPRPRVPPRPRIPRPAHGQPQHVGRHVVGPRVVGGSGHGDRWVPTTRWCGQAGPAAPWPRHIAAGGAASSALRGPPLRRGPTSGRHQRQGNTRGLSPGQLTAEFQPLLRRYHSSSRPTQTIGFL